LVRARRESASLDAVLKMAKEETGLTRSDWLGLGLGWFDLPGKICRFFMAL